jgi:hypothetical protein
VALSLDRPASAESLYLERGDPVEPWRPVLTGDVFRGVAIPGVPQHAFTIIVAHPCTMRGAGGQLKPRLAALPVDPHQAIPLDEWVDKHYRVCPLPALVVNDPSKHYAARLDEPGTIDSAQLQLSERIACLDEHGILLLQQRFIANLARIKVNLTTLDEASRYVFEEVELLEEWHLELSKRRVDGHEALEQAIRVEMTEFDQFLSLPAQEPLRRRLLEAPQRAAVRRAVRAEIERRLSMDIQPASDQP